MSSPGVPASVPGRRQKRMGPAPFASFEDLSDELDSPEDKNNAAGSVVRLPGIREDLTPSTPSKLDESEPTPQFVYAGISLIGAACSPAANAAMSTQASAKLSLQTPSTPRIDISRASSSSHHEDSRDSTPERELFEGHDPASAKLGLGFREEGTLDLRSSTEELDFQDAHAKAKPKTRPQSPCLDSYQSQHRKDSQSSELGLLSISGRTSRLSSIGSQGSAQSRLSNASHLSVISGQSGLSRSPSPHKMLLETSFCGTKAQESAQQTVEKQGAKSEEDIEKVILSRKHDPTKAILAEGIVVGDRKAAKVPPEKPARRAERNVQTVKSDITIKVDKPTSSSSSSNNRPKLPKTIVAKSGIEYTYIPLTGPLPDQDEPVSSAKKLHETKSAPSKLQQSKSASKSRPKSVSAATGRSFKGDEPKYIRIKLKPDHMYEDGSEPSGASGVEIQKPDTLNLNDANKKSAQSFAQLIEKDYAIETEPAVCTSKTVVEQQQQQTKSISRSSTPTASPKPPRHQTLKETITSSKSPSPSLSRRSSFASLFKSKEGVLSPDSPTVPGHKRKNTLTGIIRDASDNIRERRRSRSKSRDRDKTPTTSVGPSSTESIDSKGKQKSVFSIFKSKKSNEKLKDDAGSSSDALPSIEGIEFKFKPDSNTKKKSTTMKYYETPLEGDSIRIPLHSPTYYEHKDILQELRTSSQDSQETVIEASPKTKDGATSKDADAAQKQTSKDDFQTSKESKPASRSATKNESRIPKDESRISKTEPRILKDEARHFKHESRILKDETRHFKHESRSFQDNSRSFNDESRRFQDESRSLLDESRGLLDESRSFVDESRSFADESRSFADESRSHRDESRQVDESGSSKDEFRSSKHDPRSSSKDDRNSSKSRKEEPCASKDSRDESQERRSKRGEITSMKDEFQTSKEDFRPAKEEFRASKEEFRASKEEFRASKEEFRASKEEYRASKEEFRSSKDEFRNRQSSTSSENIVFSTKLGNDNAVFTTKLPKEKHMKKLIAENHFDKSHLAEAKDECQVDLPSEKFDPFGHADSLQREDSFSSLRREVSSSSIKKPAPKTPEKPAMAEAKSKGAFEDEHNSSESERDSEFDFGASSSRSKGEKSKKAESDDVVEPERKGLVLQQDSYDEELPYIPTTLPLERSVAIPIVPVKQRGNFEMKMYPIERPRSTTPIIPSSLEDYCEELSIHHSHVEQASRTLEKLKISLPKDDGDRPNKAKSPRKIGNANWFEFAEKGITSQRQTPVSHEAEVTPPAPPLPPKGVQKEWINFEEIPERRKPPKRIQTIPSRGNIEVPESVLQDNVVYSYVNPEDCKCECHEINAREREKKTELDEAAGLQEDELPLLAEDGGDEEKSNKNIERMKLDVAILDRRSVISDSSVDLSASVEHSEANGIDQTLQTPFTSDLGVSSNRSSIISQDEPQSPESGNAKCLS